ncbi:MAG: tetratricopeptide repeat protein [Terracidiphilus sp.]|jgi:tetratricopeptide (TPR) repeat protein
MKRALWIALVLASCFAAARVHAQAPASGNGQSTPADASQKPAAAPAAGGNAFPEDTSKVPVLPSKITPALPEDSSGGRDNGAGFVPVPLGGVDRDPVRSPDDPMSDEVNEADVESSSSLAGLDKILPKSDDDQPEKRRKLTVKEPTHKEAASKDIEVGEYYLETKNWKAALSRFESAVVLDPDNPEVYWGLAEAERHVGDFWDARNYYLKLLDYDPDGPHGKAARKAIKEPEIANAKSPPVGQPGVEAPK